MNSEIETTLSIDAAPINSEVERSVPFEVRKISAKTNPDLWLKMGQLRARSYVHEHGFLDGSHVDDNGAEFDEYDEDPATSHLVVLDDAGEVVATSRLIYRDADNPKPLPSEEIFSLDTSKGPAREVSRLIIDTQKLTDEARSQAYIMKIYLIRAMTHESTSKPEAGPLYAVIEKPLLKSLRSVGVALDVMGEPIYSEKYNSSNMLVNLRFNDMAREMRAADDARIERFPASKERFGVFMEAKKTQLGLGRIALERDFVEPPREQYERNFGWISPEEHERLTESIVSIAGAGGDGGALAVQLARMGVRKFRLADPDPFEIENINRQEGCDYDTIGQNKAEVIADMIKKIQPFAEISVYTQGVTAENVTEFVEGSDLVIDETEYTRHEIGVMIAREARKNNLPVLMALNVGFGSYVTSFNPAGMSFEKYFGLSEDASLEEVAEQEVSLARWVPHIPSYADMSMFKKIAEGGVSAPTVIPGVGIAASHATIQAVAHLTKDVSPRRAGAIRYAPRGQSMDVLDGFREIRFPTAHFAKSALIAYVRTKLGKNVQMNY